MKNKRPVGRPKGTSNRKKFSDAIENQAETTMLSFLTSKNEKLKFDAAKFILEHNRGKAPQGVDLEGNITHTIEDLVKDIES